MECVCVSADHRLFGQCISPTDRAFIAVDGGDTFTIAILADSKEATGWGQAFYGELPDRQNVHIEQYKAVACGSNHVLALTESGHVMAWGWNKFGQIAAAATEKVVHMPTAVKLPMEMQLALPVRINEVAAGGMHSMAIDTCGRVWTWGCNAYGQLGTGAMTKQLNAVSLATLPPNVQIKHVAAGWAHSALISTAGEVFTFGWGLYNQLGHGSTQDEHCPVVIHALRGLDSDIVQVACGNWHTAAMTASGDLYTWGWGKDGQLAHDASIATQVLPRVVNVSSSRLETCDDDTKDVMATVCGNRFTLAMCRDGSIHWWGLQPGGYGLHDMQIYQESPHHSVLRPQSGCHVRKLAAGNCHALMLVERDTKKKH